MKGQPALPTRTAEAATFLSISPIDEDHVALKHIFGDMNVQALFTLKTSLPVLQVNRFPIVLAERDLLPGTWRDVLHEITKLADPPLLIVTSRLADEYLWAEALNLGVFDVLATPFQSEEVIRTLQLAWRHWQDRHSTHRQRTQQRAAASAA